LRREVAEADLEGGDAEGSDPTTAACVLAVGFGEDTSCEDRTLTAAPQGEHQTE
jgi:hypothetical protein